MSTIQNQRRYPRIRVRLQAVLTASGGDRSCEIRDFCDGGVFLSGTGRQDADPVPTIGEPVEVRFAADGRLRSFRLRGRVAHASSNGIGVAFVDPPPAAALLALRQRALPGRSDAARIDVDAADIERHCRQSLDEALGAVLARLFADLEPALLDASLKAETDQAQAAFFEAGSLLISRRSDIERDFRRLALSQAIEPAAVPNGPADPPDRHGLALVETAEFEDWLNLTEEVTKTERRHEAMLSPLHQRIGCLRGRPVDGRSNPYGPIALGRAFRAALRGLPLQSRPKRVVYRVFAEALDPVLAELYGRLDAHTVVLADGMAVMSEASVGRPPAPEPARPAVAATRPAPPTRPAAARRPIGAAQTVGALLNLCAQIPGSAPSSASAMAIGVEEGERRQAADTLDAYLQAILAEPGVAPGLKPYIQKLQRPLLEAAYADPTMLLAESHPVIAVLNELDRLSLAADGRGEIEQAPLRQLLGQITEGLIRNADGNPAAFAIARDQLQAVTVPLLRSCGLRIRRVQETCEGSRRLQRSRRLVDRAIASRIGGRLVPAIVPALLDAGWRQLLVLTALKHGEQTAEWTRRLDVIDRLLAWLGPDGRLPDAKDAHALVDYVDENLPAVGSDQASLNRVIDELTALLPLESGWAPRRRPDYVTVPPPQADVPLPQALADELRALRVGQWFRFGLRPGIFSTLCLAWIGEDPAEYVFVNRKGMRELELGAVAFAEHLREGRAVKVESLELPLMERTAHALVETMTEKLRFQATHDALTGLLNRKEFIRQARLRIGWPPSTEAAPGALCLLELSNVKAASNAYGLEAGDCLLKDVAAMLTERFGRDDLVARLGDDRFALLLSSCTMAEANRRAEALLKALCERRFQCGCQGFSLQVNIGLASSAVVDGDVEALLKAADVACSAGKRKGRNLIQIDREDDTAVEREKSLMRWGGLIDKLLADSGLFVRCQLIAPVVPQQDAHSHYEILLGVRDEHGDVVSPFDLILAAEHWKRITEIDCRQVRSVFDWIRRNPARFDSLGGFAINLSGQSISSDGFLAFLQEQLLAFDLPLDKISFEITETDAIGDFNRAERFIRQIRRYGCHFSLDDFGSGFSSYSYLKNLQVDYVKIDGAFIKDLADSAPDYAMVKSMNDIAHSLGMKTIAEYVENDAILEKLQDIGVDYAQGYRIGRPVLLNEL